MPKLKFALTSALGHCLLLFFFSVFLLKQNENPKINPILSAHLFSFPNLPTQKIISKKLSLNSIIKKTMPIQQSKNSSNIKESGKTQKTIKNLLLKLLHSAIAAKQIYPETALTLHQFGTVNIGFLLNPDGLISNISLLHSSGFKIIDEAAMQAVVSASPIPQTPLYLKKPAFFSIEVVFQ